MEVCLQEARRRSGMSVEDLSMKVGITSAKMKMIEAKPELATTKIAGAISAALGMSIDEISFYNIHESDTSCPRCPFGVRQ